MGATGRRGSEGFRGPKVRELGICCKREILIKPVPFNYCVALERFVRIRISSKLCLLSRIAEAFFYFRCFFLSNFRPKRIMKLFMVLLQEGICRLPLAGHSKYNLSRSPECSRLSLFGRNFPVV